MQVAAQVLPQIRHLGRVAVNRLGMDVTISPLSKRLVRLCRARDLDTVVDVGASTGQYARALRQRGFDGRLVSCEPLSGPYAALDRAARRDARWDTVRAALGAEEGEVTVNVAGNSYSSSVLDMLPAHTDAAPHSRYVGSERVPVTTADGVFARFGVDPARTLLKLDVQGYEAAVLDGAAAVLPALAAVQVELSLVPLYADQPLMDAVVDRLTGAGFQMWSIEPGFVEPGTSRMLQCDGIFVRA